MGLLKVLGRLSLSGIFIEAGYDAYSKPENRPKNLMTFFYPDAPELVKLNGATLMGAGTTLGLGIFPKLSALILLAAFLPKTIAENPFWLASTQEKVQAQRLQFLKNLGIIGGLLFVLADKKKAKTVE